jgi:hypothetical protein
MRAARRETLQKDVKIAREKARAALTRPALFAILFKLYRRGSILRAALRGELSEWSMVQHSKSKPFFVSLFSESLDITGFFGVSQFHILLVLPIRSLQFPR